MLWGNKGINPVVTLGWFVCLSITMATESIVSQWTTSPEQLTRLFDIIIILPN